MAVVHHYDYDYDYYYYDHDYYYYDYKQQLLPTVAECNPKFCVNPVQMVRTVVEVTRQVGVGTSSP